MVKETAALNIRKIDPALRARFKAKCAASGVSMEDRAVELIKADVDGKLTLKKK